MENTFHNSIQSKLNNEEDTQLANYGHIYMAAIKTQQY